MNTLVGKKLVHVTTVDMSLALLLGPQLRAFAEAGMEVIGVSAPGPFVPQLESWGIRHEPLRHATRSAAVGQDVMAFVELWRLFRRLKPDIVHTHNPKPGLYGRVAARAAGVPGVVNTVHGLYASPEDRALRRAAVYGLERAASCAREPNWSRTPKTSAFWPVWAYRATSWCSWATASTCNASVPDRTTTSPTGSGQTSASTRTPSWSGRWRAWSGRRAFVSSSPQLSRSAIRIPNSSSSSSGDPIPTRPTPSPPTSSPPPVAADESSSPAAGTIWSSYIRVSISSCCPRTVRASPDRPWRQPPAACP